LWENKREAVSNWSGMLQDEEGKQAKEFCHKREKEEQNKYIQ